VLRHDEALADPQATAREMIVEMDHPLISELTKDGVGFDAHPEAQRDARPGSSPGNDSDIS
jgi:hypothetical protein